MIRKHTDNIMTSVAGDASAVVRTVKRNRQLDGRYDAVAKGLCLVCHYYFDNKFGMV